MDLNVKLYKNYSAPNVATKNLSAGIDVTLTLKGTGGPEHLEFIVTRPDGNYLGYNYLYCAQTQRYYFVTQTYEPGGLIKLTCVVDPLTTFSSGVRGLTCLIDRQEGFYDPYLFDPLMPISQGSVVKAISGGTIGMASGTHLYLTCIGAVEEEPEEGGGDNA